ncbi:hypothetical protein ACFCYN_09885 [Gottfriedia sp. NPDC056225]|uniref:hypothetical protein n=1 Tax=Gottfriedia sp. NPDC056225 TaxID=3345751 RepID=UPI0035DA25D9
MDNLTNETINQAHKFGMLDLQFTILKLISAGFIITLFAIIIMSTYFFLKTKHKKQVMEYEHELGKGTSNH